MHVGFGFGCCWGGPWGWGGYWPGYYPYYGYPYPYAYPPAYAAAPVSYISQASASAPVDVAPLPPAVAPPASFDSNNCREYQTSVTIDGRAQRAFGRVCRQSDGSWRVVQ